MENNTKNIFKLKEWFIITKLNDPKLEISVKVGKEFFEIAKDDDDLYETVSMITDKLADTIHSKMNIKLYDHENGKTKS